MNPAALCCGAGTGSGLRSGLQPSRTPARPRRIARDRQPPGLDSELVALLDLDALTALAWLGQELRLAAFGTRPLYMGTVERSQARAHSSQKPVWVGHPTGVVEAVAALTLEAALIAVWHRPPAAPATADSGTPTAGSAHSATTDCDRIVEMVTISESDERTPARGGCSPMTSGRAMRGLSL